MATNDDHGSIGGESVQARRADGAAAVAAALSGVEVSEAYQRQGIVLPEIGTQVAHPVAPDALKADEGRQRVTVAGTEFERLRRGGWPIYAARLELVVALLRRVRDEFIDASSKSPGDEDALVQAARYTEWLADALAAAASNCRAAGDVFSEPQSGPVERGKLMQLLSEPLSEWETPRMPGPLHAEHRWADDPGPLLEEASTVLRRSTPPSGLPGVIDRLRMWTRPA